MIHPTSDVHSSQIGKNTLVWQFCVILKDAEIGEDCNINANVFIENDVIIGDRVTVKSGVQLWNGIRVKDDVFVGPNVAFTNDTKPRSKQYPAKFLITIINQGCSIGANATILPGLTLGKFSMIGAGSVVTKNVPDFALFVGNPARFRGWLNIDGSKMVKLENGEFQDSNGDIWIENNQKLIKK